MSPQQKYHITLLENITLSNIIDVALESNSKYSLKKNKHIPKAKHKSIKKKNDKSSRIKIKREDKPKTFGSIFTKGTIIEKPPTHITENLNKIVKI